MSNDTWKTIIKYSVQVDFYNSKSLVPDMQESQMSSIPVPEDKKYVSLAALLYFSFYKTKE